jgi:hypothetical protein
LRAQVQILLVSIFFTSSSPEQILAMKLVILESSSPATDIASSKEVHTVTHRATQLFIALSLISILKVSRDSTALSVDARWLGKSRLKSFGDLEHHAVRKAWTKDCNGERHPVLRKSSGT